MKSFFLLFFLFSNVWALGNFAADYDVRIRGIHAGEMSFHTIISPDTYRVDTVITPSAAARMLGYNEIKEAVYGNIVNGKVIPHRYDRTMIDNPDYDLQYLFNAALRHVQIKRQNNNKNITYKDIIPLDILSLIMQSLLDKENNVKAEKYALLSEEKLRTYKIERMPDEKWKEKNKIIDVSVYCQKSENRQTFIYFAENPLRLIKLQQMKNDTTQFALKLLNYRKI